MMKKLLLFLLTFSWCFLKAQPPGVSDFYSSNGNAVYDGHFYILWEYTNCEQNYLHIEFIEQDEYTLNENGQEIYDFGSTKNIEIEESLLPFDGEYEVIGKNNGVIVSFLAGSVNIIGIEIDHYNNIFEGDSLFVCSDFNAIYSPRLKYYLSNNSSFGGCFDLSQDPNSAIYVNGELRKTVILSELGLKTGDKLQIKREEDYQRSNNECGCGEIQRQPLETPEYIVKVEKNEILPITSVIQGDTIVCPGEVVLLGQVEATDEEFSWYNISSKYWYSRDSTLLVDIPGEYRMVNTFLPGEGGFAHCHQISEIHTVVKGDDCSVGYVSGYVFESGTYNSETGLYDVLSGITVKTNSGLVSVSDGNGFFEFEYDSINDFSAIYVADPDYYSDYEGISTDDDFMIDINENLYTYLLEQNDLGVSLQSGRNRPGFTIPYYVTVSNKSKNEQTSNVSVSLEDGLTYSSLEDENTPNVISSQSLTWNGVTVASGETKRLKFYAELDRLTPLETELVSIASLSLADDVEENNVDTLVAEVTGSYDPNDKLVSFTGMNTLGYVTDTTLFTYTVRFQNTGNDTAFTVRVEDIIDQDFDLSTIKVIDASHNYVMTIDNDTVNWTFNDILLVDSTTNEPASHGFVRYQIAQNEGNEDGTVLTNKAWIYFDYNDPIITNETSNIVGNDQVLFLENQNKTSEISASLYPNPASSRITVSEGGFFSVYNVLGDQVYRSEIERDGVINIEAWVSGVYYFELKNEDGYKQGSFVKE